MRHDHNIEGRGYGLRPVADGDAAFIVELRAASPRNQHLNSVRPSVTNQLQWLRDYYLRPDDYYFVIEKISNGQAEGLIGLYNVDPSRLEAEWGRWIVSPHSLCAVESVVLILDFAFLRLGLKSVHSRTAADNSSVVSFHDNCGFRRAADCPERILIDGWPRDGVRHECRAEEWAEIRPTLLEKAAKIADRILRHDSRR